MTLLRVGGEVDQTGTERGDILNTDRNPVAEPHDRGDMRGKEQEK